MENIVAILIIVCIIVSVILYIYRAKKRGEACIGCPYAKQCGGKCNNDRENSIKNCR